MCLYKVVQKLAGRGTKVYTGWKVFEKSSLNEQDVTGFEYCFRYYFHEGKRTVPVNRWLKATEGSIGSGMGLGSRYDKGFHIYRNSYVPQYIAKISNHNHLVAVKVKFRKVVAKGRESDDAVIVAKEIYVPYKKSKRT